MRIQPPRTNAGGAARPRGAVADIRSVGHETKIAGRRATATRCCVDTVRERALCDSGRRGTRHRCSPSVIDGRGEECDEKEERKAGAQTHTHQPLHVGAPVHTAAAQSYCPTTPNPLRHVGTQLSPLRVPAQRVTLPLARAEGRVVQGLAASETNQKKRTLMRKGGTHNRQTQKHKKNILQHSPRHTAEPDQTSAPQPKEPLTV